MLRVVIILNKENHRLVCQFNNGEIRDLDILPIVSKHKHINGVENILKNDVFESVKIGEFGEILWLNIVKTNTNEGDIYWDYDISPEFAYSESKRLK
jgi:hypothetical protein